MTVEAPNLTAGKPLTEFGEIPDPLNIAVLISNKGSGTNLQAIIDAGFNVPLVISDQPDAQGLQRAEKHGIHNETMELVYPEETTPEEKKRIRDKYGEILAEHLNQNGIHVVVLAGFMTFLSKSFFDTFQGVAINIHPGVLPDENGNPLKFPNGKDAPSNKGKATQNAVSLFVPYGYAGSTVHIATVDVDSGPVVERTEFIEFSPEDYLDKGKRLYDEKLKPAEHKALIRALKNWKRIFEIAGKPLSKYER